MAIALSDYVAQEVRQALTGGQKMKKNELQRIKQTLDTLGVEEIEDRLEISPIVPGTEDNDGFVCRCGYTCDKPFEFPSANGL
jgi:hypothetical protein